MGEGFAFVIVFVGLLTVFIVAAVSAQKKIKEDIEAAKRYQQAQALKKTAKAPVVEEAKKNHKAQSTLDFSHTHIGDEMDVYDAGFGSLGEHTDEGCSELIGIRLISNDKAYSGETDQIDYDLDNIALSMVLGEALQNPKFKQKKPN